MERWERLDGFVEPGQEVKPHGLVDVAAFESGSVGSNRAAVLVLWSALGKDDWGWETPSFRDCGAWGYFSKNGDRIYLVGTPSSPIKAVSPGSLSC